jgi:LuxR family maltose regulon positive regulatory protein
MVTPILTTKLHIPPLRRSLVPRQQLLERLDQGLHRKVTLVSAPAGFGKTTLLGEWIQSLEARAAPPVRMAWVSLDDGDNDPARFSAYLAAALQPTDESAGLTGGHPFELAGTFLQESHLIKLVNQAAVLPQALVLVLDDYHMITSQVIHDAVTFLVDHLPEHLHLVLATRADPPLPLARLRAGGHLIELRQNDLRFTAEEASAFLNNIMELDLSAQDVAALAARTEGWIAGLQMAALSLQGPRSHPTTRSESIQAFTGSHRFILDYLVEEVLEQQPPAVYEFLLKTSILERLTGPLCDAILDEGRWTKDEGSTFAAEARPVTSKGETHSVRLLSFVPRSGPSSSSQEILEYLESANLFIVPLDDERRWYRYHRLFSDLLRKRLWQTSPDLVPALHRRASEWHEGHGMTAAAIDHALAGHDFERALTLIEGSVQATLMRSEVTTFLTWLERLPDEMVRTHPALCFFHAWALLMSGRSPAVLEQRLADIACVQDASGGTGVLAARMAAFRAYLMLFRSNTRAAVELCRQAQEHLPESDVFLRNMVAWILSLARLDDGDLQAGKEALQEVARMGQETGNSLVAVGALCHQAELQTRQGRLHQARETLERALQLATDSQGRRLPIASEALIGLGKLEREWNHLELAANYLAESIELASQWSEMAAFDAYFPMAGIRLAQGDVDGAWEAIETARLIAQKSEATKIDDIVADLQQAYFFITQGDAVGATRWAERRGLLPDISLEPCPGLEQAKDYVNIRLRKYEHLILARLLILQGRPSEALDVLKALLVLARQRGRVDLIIEIQILRALAWQVEGRDTQAIDALAEALSLAEPGGHLRIFLDKGEAMARLLRQAAARGIAPAYVAKLLAALEGSESVETQAKPSHPHAQPLIEPLSERELEVLRLLANGMSNPEIADELVVAVSTVRSHCKSIYGKLDVHKRWDAVQRAQELDLI